MAKENQRLVCLSARPEMIEIDPVRTSLIVVDMQNAFLKQGGFWDQLGFDISGAPSLIRVTRQVCEGCRQAGIRVVYLQHSYNEKMSDAGGPTSPHYQKAPSLRMKRQRPELTAQPTVVGSWDWQIVEELTPEPADLVVQKRRFNGFVGTTLEMCLRAWEIRWLLFCGIATNVCVESTARDAFFRDFWPILIEDALNHAGPDFNRKATLYNFENFFGWVCNSPSLLTDLNKR